MKRRNFLKSTVAGGLAAKAIGKAGDLPRRVYRDGIQLSIVGCGGMLVVDEEQKDADRYVAEAYDRGVNYFDVAPSYGQDGEAEIKLGLALKPYRKNVFLACKTGKRDAAGARQELEQSLRRLYTDHVDLYQFHAVSSMKDVEQILGPGGAAETFLAAKKEGKARHLGFSAHSAEAAIALMDRFQLDSVLFPVNYVLFSQGNFGPQILEHARRKGLARMSLKSLSQTSWGKNEVRAYKKCWYKPIDDRSLAGKSLRFTLSQDITAAIPPGEAKLFRMALDIASVFKPLSEQEKKDLLASAVGFEPIFRA